MLKAKLSGEGHLVEQGIVLLKNPVYSLFQCSTQFTISEYSTKPKSGGNSQIVLDCHTMD